MGTAQVVDRGRVTATSTPCSGLATAVWSQNRRNTASAPPPHSSPQLPYAECVYIGIVARNNPFPTALVGLSICLFTGISVYDRKTSDASAQAAAQFRQPIAKDQKDGHALSRLTFGPRPGDLQYIQQTGIKKWIDLQLHPQR